jgi:hypothetical protein
MGRIQQLHSDHQRIMGALFELRQAIAIRDIPLSHLAALPRSSEMVLACRTTDVNGRTLDSRNACT